VDAFKLPGGLTPSYLELDFKSNHPFVVGLIGNGSGSTTVLEILVLNTTEEWKKVYVNTGATVSRQSGVIDYTVYIRANLESGYSEAEILIDNLKLVHF
jgi:ABC-type Na+ transport system ATPase subunit NatA